MAPKKKPTQKTKQGYEIPVPKRADFDRLVKKAAKGNSARRSTKG